MAQYKSPRGKDRNITAARLPLRILVGPLTIFFIVVSLVGGPVTNVQAATAITFTGAELLSRPTDTSIMITIVPASTIEYYYEYGTAPGVYTAQTPPATVTVGQPGKMVIGGLIANTRYYYRMKYHLPGETDWVTRTERSFWTQREKGSTFKFDVTSDSHVNIMLGSATTWTQTMNNIAADNPDFLMDLGDTFAMDGVTSVTTAETNYRFQYQFFNLVSHSASIFLAPGNHEQQEGWHLDDTTDPALAPPVIGTNAQKKYFPNPVPDAFYSGNTDEHGLLAGDRLREDYYAWTWGDALFVVIDPYWYTMYKPFAGNTGGGEPEGSDGDRWHWTLGVTQYNWLKTILENSSAKYKFIFAHHMTGGSQDYVRGGANPAHLVEWGGYNEAGTVNEWSTKRPVANGWGVQPIHQMLVANNVSGFFHGHDHQYGYEKRDSVVYQSVPSGSFTGNFGIYSTGSGYTIWADSTQSPGRLRVLVGPSQTTVDFIKANAANPAYSYTILPATRELTVAVDPTEGGATDPAAGGHAYGVNEDVTVAATANSGYAFDHWSGACTGSDPCQVTMDEDKSVTANFMVSPDVAITSGDNHPTLTWQHQVVAVDHYEVHRSLTAPYFAPDAGSWLADAPTSMPAFTDDDPVNGADLSVAGATYFYAVVPVNASGDPIGSSNRTGAFVFGLEPGAGS